jgi:hypothetical protein
MLEFFVRWVSIGVLTYFAVHVLLFLARLYGGYFG